MKHLLTLRLEENQFSSSIGVLSLQNLQDFNISTNQISGEIPTALSGFPCTCLASLIVTNRFNQVAGVELWELGFPCASSVV
ncbi:hypothetical protein L1887_21068 [Cichorium endivia]|nr:hypothetical protein L1887_21068 [Cichorium endivia]